MTETESGPAKRRRRPGDVLARIVTTPEPSAVLLLAAAAAFAMGYALGIGNDHRHLPLTLSAGTAAMLLAYPLIIGAIFTLPAVSSTMSRLRLIVDGLLIVTAAATFSWYFLMGPIVEHHASQQMIALNVAYPVLDLALVATLLVLSNRSAEVTETAYAPLTVGMMVLLFVDSLQQYEAVSGMHITTVFVSGLRIFVCITLLLAAAGLTRSSFAGRGAFRRRSLHDTARTKELPKHVWDSLLPYALVPSAATLTFFASRSVSFGDRTEGVIVGTVLLACLGLVRQVMAIRENLHLYGQVNQAYEESIAHARTMNLLNDELQRTRDELQARNERLLNVNLSLTAQATTDPLTGLPNHRQMVSAIDSEIDRAQRYGRPCSLLFLDLDHFKALNDTCGHLNGDSVLRELVMPIAAGLRSMDQVGRWGGEEFVVVLPETDIPDALTVAQRIRHSVETHRFSVAGGSHLTCSIGLATYPYDASSRDNLVEAADQAMYAAKRLGRNQVRTASDPSVIGFMSEVKKVGSREEVTLWGTVEALTTIVRAHNPDDDTHAARVADLAMRVAGEMGLSPAEARTIGLAARLHDLGKLSIPNNVLNTPAPLSDDDWAKLRPHPSIGADVVRKVPALAMIAPLIQSHHEHWDGRGYPDGLSGASIPIGARIIAACDAYCAMISPRPYRPPRDSQAAIDELIVCAGKQFDPNVVSCLEHVINRDSSEVLQQAV